jgi:anthranilate phosphoribosyltransferase
MSTLSELTVHLEANGELSPEQAAEAAGVLAAPDVADGVKASFLAALAQKGETPAEIAAFALAYRGLARDPGVSDIAPHAIDVVGTGGDHAGGFNVSSLVTLVLACAGVPVMKHGNRGITSKCGSADLLSALGVDIEAPPEKTRRALEQLGFCFFFAPVYHPAFRHVAGARKLLASRGQRTVFNILGPLINPGRPAHALIGVYAPHLVPKLARTLEQMGTAAGLVAHGVIAPGQGIDEMTSATHNEMQGVGRLRAVTLTWKASDLGLQDAPFSDLIGGDVAENLGKIEAMLAGRGPRGLADTVALNVAAGLWITGRQPSLRDGIEEARELLLGGAVRRKLSDTRDFFRT